MHTRARGRLFATSQSEPDLSPNARRLHPIDPAPLQGNLLNPNSQSNAQLSVESGDVQSRDHSPSVESSMVWEPMSLSLAGNPRSTVERGQMDDCEENLGDFQPETSDSVVTEARLVAELNALRKHIDVVITKCRDSTVSRIPGFIDASEERVRQSVLDTVSTDYNQIGIRCVATRSEIKSELAKVRSALKLDNKAILESAQRIDGIVSQIEELNLISSDLSRAESH